MLALSSDLGLGLRGYRSYKVSRDGSCGMTKLGDEAFHKKKLQTVWSWRLCPAL